MLALTAPHVYKLNGTIYRRLGLDGAIFKRCNEALVSALQGGRQLTRNALRTVLQNAGIETDEMFRMAYLLMQAELDAVICSGPRRGKQFSYCLLDERVPAACTL